MVPALSTVVRLRYYVRVGARSLGAGLILLSLFRVSDLSMDTLGALATTGLSVSGLIALALSALAPAVTGLLIIWLSPRIARWLVPIPRARCPQCDYSLYGVTEMKCPECGLPLEAALMPRGAKTYGVGESSGQARLAGERGADRPSRAPQG